MKKSNSIVLTAEIQILPGFEEEVMAAAEVIWQATRREEGCESFLFNTKRDTPGSIVFFERFKSEADFEAHRNFEHTLSFTAFLKGKVKGDGAMLTFLIHTKIN